MVAGSCAMTRERLEGVRILLVEDDHDAREVFRATLALRGAEVLDVASVAKALSALVRFRPDVLVSDVSLPLRDGFWLIRELRAIPGLADLPAIAVTGIADSGATLGAGFEVCLRKPVDPVELRRAVQALVSRR